MCKHRLVYPAEVELVVYRYPGVLECAVVGVPDERWGEVGCVFVLPRPGASPRQVSTPTACAGAYADEALHVEITAGDMVEGARLRLATRLSRVADGVVVCEGSTEILLPGGGAAPTISSSR